MTVHIALDVMGGDYGPVELVSGALQAVDQLGVNVTLVGDRSLIEQQLQIGGRVKTGLDIIHTSQVISMHESPVDALRKKKDASIVVAFELLKNNKVDAVVSAGNSGATMAAALKMLGRLKKVSRPGIASVFPTLKKPLVMMDVGANVDCRPQHLFEFGIMGSAFSRVLCGTERPRIGLLSIGEEGGKGNLLVKNAHELFQKSALNFVGNVEGREIFSGNVDVIVCDGFVGNVCLKVSEGLAETILTMLRNEMAKSLLARLGYGLARSAFRNFKKRVDYTEYGGAPLLGLKGIGIVCHGRSNAVAIKNAIKVAAEMVRNKVNSHISTLLESAEHLADATAESEAKTAIELPGINL
jgi:glycerol-3-phosphate acyltransferase PlsX